MNLLRLSLLLVVACVGCQTVFPAPPAHPPVRMKKAVDPDPQPEGEDNDYNYTACTLHPEK